MGGTRGPVRMSRLVNLSIGQLVNHQSAGDYWCFGGYEFGYPTERGGPQPTRVRARRDAMALLGLSPRTVRFRANCRLFLRTAQ